MTALIWIYFIVVIIFIILYAFDVVDDFFLIFIWPLWFIKGIIKKTIQLLFTKWK